MAQFLASAVKVCENAIVYNITNFFFQKSKKVSCRIGVKKFIFGKFLLEVLAFPSFYVFIIHQRNFNQLNLKVSKKFR
jgi:hypothetical protein